MKTVRVLQLGTKNYSEAMQVSACAEWHYEPDFSALPEKDFDLVLLDREITEEEFAYLVRFSKAYTVFITESVFQQKKERSMQLCARKMGQKISEEALIRLLKEEVRDYFSGSYGEKYMPKNLSIAQGFQGAVSWRGYESVDLEGDYGNEMTQIVFWRNNLPAEPNHAIEFWLEYKKEEAVEIVLEITMLQFSYGTDAKLQHVWSFSEKELEDMVYIENKGEAQGYLFTSLKAKGRGKLSIIALHDRHARRGKGVFLPGGKRAVTSEREEIFYYFDPGNLKPPLNVYFSGYKTREGFEGYRMMRSMEHPFLLLAEARLEGGNFYLGSEEYENEIERIIRDCMLSLGFQNTEVILSGLSMGTFGALYYGCRLRPNTILIGKPLASLGDVAENTRIKCSSGTNVWVDVLQKECNSLGQEAMQRLNHRFWDLFDHTDWSKTRFAVAYMIEDDMDGTAYEKLQSHLKAAGAKLYGKGLHGRHNDNTAGIVNWFVKQYRHIIQHDFGGLQSEMDRQK